jgi:hypothetical protein
MAIDLSSVVVDDVIVHDVPEHQTDVSADDAVTLSETVMPDLDATRKNFFRERINRSLAGHAFEIIKDPDQPSQLPGLIINVIADRYQLVAASQQMAKALYAVQTKVNNPGLLTVITCHSGGRQLLGVLKLQRHEAMQMSMIETDDGKTFSAAIFGDLTLTDDPRVFKASLFSANRRRETSLEGLVSDEQRGYHSRSEVANFFLSTFLGCKLKEAAEVATKRFYEVSRDFIGSIEDGENQRNYTVGLTATLTSPARTITPTEFAEQFIALPDRQNYLDYLEEHGVHEAAFDKNIRLVENRLRKIVLRTTQDIRIAGSPDAINDLLDFEEGEGDQPDRIIIRDRLDRPTRD